LANLKGGERISFLAQLTKNFKKENPQKAIQWGKEALELLKSYPNEKIQATILNEISDAYRLLGENYKEKKYAQKSLEIAKQINDKQNIADALNSLGKVSTVFGEFEQARNYFLESLSLYKELKDKTKRALVNNSIAGIYFQQGDYSSALEYLFQALDIYKEENDQWGISAINANIGAIFWQLNELDKSLEHYQTSLKIFEKLNDQNSASLSHTNIGLIYFKKKEYNKALKEFKTALKLSKKVRNRSAIANNYYNLGRVQKELKNFSLALKHFNKSLAIRKELNERKGIAATLIHSAPINQHLGNYEEAIKQSTQGLEIALQIKTKEEISDAYLVLSEIFEERQNYKKALEYFKKYKEVKDTILNEETTRQIAAKKTNFDLQQRQKEIEILTKDKEIQRIVLIFFILFAFLILLLAFVIYTRYRLKSRSNKALEKEIEERRQTELKLRESEEKFRVLAEKSVVGIWIIQDDIIKYANPRSSTIFKCPLEKIIGRNPLDLVMPEDRPIVYKNLQARLNGTSTTLSYEFRGLANDEEMIYLESYGSSTHYQGQAAVLESIIDITRRKKTESELSKSRKMESIGILAGGIAHDFNNLLAVIVGNASMLKLSYNDMGDKFDNFLRNIEKASNQAADLAQKFITFSEGGWLMRKKVKIINILKDTIHLSPELKNVPFEISIPPELDYILGDERQLRQVMTNLLINASEATAEIPKNKQKISITAKNISLEKENHLSLEEGNYINICVKDNGKGIQNEHLEKIFDPYFSTKNTVSQKGLGLGLAICYSIVKKHGGHIAIDSHARQGTSVNVYLPVYDKAQIPDSAN